MRSSVISTFPFSPTRLVKELSPYVCRTYTKARKYGVNIADFGSESAVVMTMGERTIIFYDDTKPISHVGFSILHEFGHPIIGHDFHIKDEANYGRYEVETNYFAAQLLMPEQILRELQRRGMPITSSFLQVTFGVSSIAADKRISTLTKTNSEWRSRFEHEYDDIILLKYAAFLDGIKPLSGVYDIGDELEMQRRRDSWF